MAHSSQSEPIDISAYPKLDAKQVGHLRHYHNLVSQIDGDWHHFGTEDAHEEFDDARRYQLATMAYAIGAAHYHRLPALLGAFKSLMQRVIHKMLCREVWSYWFLSSHGGKIFDPDLKDLRKPWADPIVKENIMYSGHLLLMTSLHAMLFDDDRYEKEGGLTLRWNPLFWGEGSKDFVYDNRKLQQVILQQLEENEWVGVCCEPNAIFVICNQFPLVAMRYNDIRDGTNHLETEILPKYKAALTKKGMLGRDGLYAAYYALKQNRSIAARHGAHTAWANAFMNAWNSDFVRSSYEQQTLGFLTHFDSGTQLQPTQVAAAFRRLVLEDGRDPNDKATLQEAREVSDRFVPKMPFETLNWLSFTMMLSELGEQKELNDLLEYADKHLQPTWENGGLYYPRNSELVDGDWNLIHMEPHSGNSGIGCARLNVPDGQKIMWEKPRTRKQLSSEPWIDGTDLESVDFLRGIWDSRQSAMVITLKSWNGEKKTVQLIMRNVGPGSWGVYLDGNLTETKELSTTGEIQIEHIVGHEETDVVVQKVG